MNINKLLAGTAVVSALLIAGAAPAGAGVLPIGGYTGPIGLNFSNYEDFLTSTGAVDTTGPTVGDQNVGIFDVMSLTAPGDPVALFSSGGLIDGVPSLLVGVFNGITVTSVSGPTSAEATTNTGGVFTLYSVSVANYVAAGGDQQGISGSTTGGCTIVGGNCYNGITNEPTSLPVLTMTLVPGIDGTGVNTLDATVNATLNPPTGSAAFDGLVSGNSQLAPDVSGKDSFCPDLISTGCPGADVTTATSTSWQLASQDPISGTAVPEPGSLAILGGGLLLLNRFRARRQRKADSNP
jgi:hypothetical protein